MIIKFGLVRALTNAQARTRTSSLARTLCNSPSAQSSPVVALKNVTKSNFEPALAELRRHVREADFVSIDLEMTGVTSTPWRETCKFDRPDIQYLKVKDSAEKFAVVQFGVCPFRWDPQSSCFIAHPHNFFIFPRQGSPNDGLYNEFLCQTSSIEFLAKYQFDFNTCIYEGISYLSRSQEEEALRRLDYVYDVEPSGVGEAADAQLLRMADILFAERMKINIREWRDGLLTNRTSGSDFLGSSSAVDRKCRTTFFQTLPALTMNGFTARQLRLIKLVTKQHFKDLAFVQVTDDTSDSQHLIVYTDSSEDHDLLLREIRACHRRTAEMKLKAAVGFRQVIDLLSSEKKLIVGHNCFLDLAHIYGKFIGPLPSTAEEFVAAVQMHFPSIIDTKLLLNSNDLLFGVMKRGSTSLSKAFKLFCHPTSVHFTNSSPANTLSVKVEVQVDEQRFSNWNSGAKHEAGYDAFMTGSVFAQACCHLGVDFSSCTAADNLHHHEKLQKYINLLYLTWAGGNIIDLKTGKIAEETLGSTNLKRQNSKIFSNIVLLWGLPQNIRPQNLRACICKVFGTDSVISVYNLDDTAAFVQFSKEELASDFLELKDKLERDNDPISVLHPLSKLWEGGYVCAASYETYKEICSSAASEVLFADQAKAVGIKWRTRLMETATLIGQQKLKEMNSSFVCEDQQSDVGMIRSENLSSSHCPGDEPLDCYPIEAQLSK